MSCSTIVHDVEAKQDHLIKYTADYDTDSDSEAVSKQNNLLIEILETFRKDNGFRITES